MADSELRALSSILKTDHLNKRRSILVLLILLSALTYLDRICIAVAGPRMQQELGISSSAWGWVLGIFLISYGAFEIPTGALGDRIGQRTVLCRIVIWWSAFTALTGIVSSLPSLLVTRLLFGAGEAGAYPNMSGVIARHLPPAERARAQGFVWGASRLGGALAPLLIVPMQQAFGWRASFLLLGLLGLAWTAAWLMKYRDRASAVHAPAVPWRALAKSRQMWILIAMYWCYVWGSIFYLSWFPAYLVRGRGFLESEMARYAALPFLAGAAGNIAGGYLSDKLSQRFGRRAGRSFLGAACLAASSLLLFGAAIISARWAALLFLTLSFGFMDCMLPAAWALCVDIGQGHAGLVSGAMNSAGQLGGFVCAVVFGYLVERTGSFNAPLFLISCMVLVSSALFLAIDPDRYVLADS